MLTLKPRALKGDWQRPHDISPIMYELLRRRDIASEAEARAYLKPSTSDLHDPFLLSDMRVTVDRLRKAVDTGEAICVYGDYDADGVCACAILVSYLRSLGARAEPYLPSRHNEGYGLNESAIRKLAQRFKLLVTVDCGITAIELTKFARSIGLDTLITDHHKPEAELPDCPVVNPLLNDYPFPHLCGAGVAFKLVCAMGGLERALEYVDYAAIATIADIVKLIGENRVIASVGLKKINASARPGIRALMRAAEMGERPLSAESVAYQLAPRLNAGGRLGDAMRAYTLLTETNYDKCDRLAAQLNDENARRKQLEAHTLTACERALKSFDFPEHRAIVLAGEDWNSGVIGLAASRLTEKYHYPSVILSQNEGVLTGSCRSIEGVDIHAALSHTAKYLVKFGGHSMAAGLTLKRENLDAFRAALNEYLFERVPAQVYIPEHEYDAEVKPEELDPELVNSLSALAPTGCGNPAPAFRMRAQAAFARAVGADRSHLKFRLQGARGAMDAIWFRQGERANQVKGDVDALFSASVNAYQGRVSVQAEIKALKPQNPLSRLSEAQADIERAFPSFLTHALYNHRYSNATETARALDLDAYRALARSSAQGLIILAAGGTSAKAALEALGDIDADVEIGAYPTDPRLFRALAVCPAQDAPEGYKHVISAGAPEGFMRANAYLSFVPIDPAFESVPDIDQLRAFYTGARALSKRPHRFQALSALVNELAQAAALTQATGAWALMALIDMNLINLRAAERDISIEVPTAQKCDPEQNELYQSMRAWHKRAREGRRDE